MFKKDFFISFASVLVLLTCLYITSDHTNAGDRSDVDQTKAVSSVSAVSSNSSTPAAVRAKSVQLDARRLIFGGKGDTLALEYAVTPTGVDPAGVTFTSSDRKVATVNKRGTVKARGWGECTVTARIGKVKKVCQVTVAKKWAAITFDDGPYKYTPKLLNGFKEQNVQATFFVIGSMAKSNIKTLKKVHKNGHEIANHTYSHTGRASTLKSQLSKTDKIIKKVTKSEVGLMRPPGGNINGTTKHSNKSIIMWTVDPKDWRDRDVRTIRKRVLRDTKSGSIILLHDIHPKSVTAALQITEALKKKGYAFVTVSDLIGKPKANKIYRKGRSKVRTMKITW